MATLSIRLFGPPEVCGDAGEIGIPRRRIRALLYYLAATRRPHSRAQLAALFWADTAHQEAGRAVSDALYRLRRALQPAEVIAAAGDQVWLERGCASRIDLDELEAAVAGLAGPGSAGDEALERLSALW